MPAPVSVLKVGGSLAADPPRLTRLLGQIAAEAEGAAVIVPGGGPFAHTVRTAQSSLGFSNTLAHRLAIDAMEQMAEIFRALEPRLLLAASLEAVDSTLRAKGVPVWFPRELREGHPDIPESWDVTSDSLALWLATRIGAARCVLVKSANAPAGTGPANWTRLGLVDRAFPDFARAFSGEIVLRGPAYESGAA